MRSSILIRVFALAISFLAFFKPRSFSREDAAVSFFAEVGDMGGASAAGPIGKDPEQVAALPPQNQ